MTLEQIGAVLVVSSVAFMVGWGGWVVIDTLRNRVR